MFGLLSETVRDNAAGKPELRGVREHSGARAPYCESSGIGQNQVARMNPYESLFRSMWAAWGLYWLVSSFGNKSTSRRETTLDRLAHLGPLLVGFVLIASRQLPFAILYERFLPGQYWQLSFWFGAAIAGSGFALAIWARVHLGRNWSASVTVKEQHEHITSGPYAGVRHPIYSGLLLAFFGTAVALGEWRGILAFFIVAASLWAKLVREERFMSEHFGHGYDSYRQRVAALIPYVI
jgi:protein-S-isoprenylcysteine O-methyltransferase Ste14